MKISTIVSVLTLEEKGKSKVKVGDMREIIGKLSDLLYQEFEALGYKETPKVPTLKALYLNGKRRNKQHIPEAAHGDETAQTQQQTGSNEYSDSAEGESVDP